MAPDRLVRDELDRMFVAANRSAHPLGIKPDTVDRLAKAITERRQITAQYTHFDAVPAEIVLQPWSLIFTDEGPYLYALCMESSKPEHVAMKRIFNIARMKSIRITKQPFAYPLRADHDPANIFSRCFGVMLPSDGVATPTQPVVLRFAKSMRAYLDAQQIHRAQTDMHVESRGTIRITLDLHVTYDLVRWVRGHGKSVTVVAPHSLRDWVESGLGGEAHDRFMVRTSRTRPA
jgi:predicted DNA-binding transcriptional regulator YafY